MAINKNIRRLDIAMYPPLAMCKCNGIARLQKRVNRFACSQALTEYVIGNGLHPLDILHDDVGDIHIRVLLNARAKHGRNAGMTQLFHHAPFAVKSLADIFVPKGSQQYLERNACSRCQVDT